MAHFFEKRDRWGNGMAPWIMAVMVFLIPLSVWGLSSIHMDNEVHSWIPKDNLAFKEFDWYRSNFPLEEPILVTWDGSSLDDPRIAPLVKGLQGQIESDGRRKGGSKLIERVRTPQELLAQIQKSKISRDDALDRLKGVLIGAGKIRIRLTDLGRSRKGDAIELLKAAAAGKLGLKGIGITEPEAIPTLPAVAEVESPAETETQETAATPTAPAEPVSVSERESAPYDLVASWPGHHWDREQTAAFQEMAKTVETKAKTENGDRRLVEDCYSIPGSPIALAVFLSEPGRADRTTALKTIRESAQFVGIPESALHLGGSPVAGSAINQEVLRAAWNGDVGLYQMHRKSLVLLSGLVGGVLALWMLRSLRLAGLVLAISYFTTLISTALVPVTGGSMNMVLVVMPTLLLVTTLSAAIHLANYWKHAAAENLRTSVIESVKTAWSPCMWAGITSAIGQASLLTSSLTPVRDFGIYSAVGTLISLVVTLYGLPALLQIWPGRKPTPDELDHHGWEVFAGWVARHHKAITVASLVISAVCTWGLYRFRTETKVIRYFSDRTGIVKDYNFIEGNLAGIVPVDVIIRFDTGAQGQFKFLQRADLVRKIQHDMEQLPDISGSLSLVDFLPAIDDPGEAAPIAERRKFVATSRTVEHRVKSGEQTSSSMFLTTALKPTELNAEGDELWRITAQVAVMSSLDYGDLTTQLDGICSNVLRVVSGSGGRDGAEKVPALGTSRRYHPGASHVVTGMVPLFLASQRELLSSFIWSFAGAFGSIALVIMLQMRHPIAGLLAMVPNILPIVAIFGIISWSGLQVDIGSTVTASIALGITIDGTLHLVTWFRIGIQQGKTREQAMIQALGHCGPAMWQTSLVVSLGLLMLYPSDLTLISRFGWLMAALLGAASAVDLILTPAMLVGPLGRIIQRCTLPEAADAEEKAELQAARETEPEQVAATPPPKPHIQKKGVRLRRID